MSKTCSLWTYSVGEVTYPWWAACGLCRLHGPRLSVPPPTARLFVVEHKKVCTDTSDIRSVGGSGDGGGSGSDDPMTCCGCVTVVVGIVGCRFLVVSLFLCNSVLWLLMPHAVYLPLSCVCVGAMFCCNVRGWDA